MGLMKENYLQNQRNTKEGATANSFFFKISTITRWMLHFCKFQGSADVTYQEWKKKREEGGALETFVSLENLLKGTVYGQVIQCSSKSWPSADISRVSLCTVLFTFFFLFSLVNAVSWWRQLALGKYAVPNSWWQNRRGKRGGGGGAIYDSSWTQTWSQLIFW